MGRPGRFAPALLIGVALLAPPIGARADTLDAPVQITAQADGSFSYDVTFHKGPGPSQFAGNAYYGEANVQGGLWGDCFCLESCPVLNPGDSFTFEVAGRLIDVQQPGRMYEEVAMCSSSGASATTDILPFASSGVPPMPGDDRFWNAPNPFATGTTFHYRVPEAGPVSLGVYDLTGRLVARLVEGVQPAGPQQVSWDLRAHPEARRAGGVLFARLAMPGTVRTLPVIIAR
jgi:hypothetical protein